MNNTNLSAARRSDLDALRASAMLLGIVLHASLSFFPSLWMVNDRQQLPALSLLFSAIHGFRMPLFFVMSGFFSAMLLSRRGRGALVKHRFRRVFLPFLLGLVTIIPATNWISGVALSSAMKQSAASTRGEHKDDIWSAANEGDLIAIERHLAAGAKVNVEDGQYGMPPVIWAAVADRAEAVELLIRNGADVNMTAKGGGTALHAAAFLGHEPTVRALVKHGANVNAPNERGETPLDVASVDEGTTRYFATMLQLKVHEGDLAGHKATIAELLRQSGAATGKKSGGLVQLLMQIPLFSHLWFLWFLWWLVLGYAALSAIGSLLPTIQPPAWLVLSPARYLWLIPLTMLPQAFMEGADSAPIFGPDTSTGLLPIPHIFAYYAIFFGFGALYHGFDDQAGKVGNRWWLPLAIALVLVFPLGMALVTGWPGPSTLAPGSTTRRLLTILLQSAYPWLMTFGLMGVFRRIFSTESPRMRYLSDSAYWLYLAHLPLVIGVQYLVRAWPIPALVKFPLIVVVVTVFLLWTYQTFVRYHWLGRLLNGPRTRPEPLAVEPSASPA